MLWIVRSQRLDLCQTQIRLFCKLETIPKSGTWKPKIWIDAKTSFKFRVAKSNPNCIHTKSFNAFRCDSVISSFNTCGWITPFFAASFEALPTWRFLYCNKQGHLLLRQALSDHWREDGIYIAPDDIFISNGCMPALSLLIQQMSREGDSIIVPTPTF